MNATTITRTRATAAGALLAAIALFATLFVATPTAGAVQAADGDLSTGAQPDDRTWSAPGQTDASAGAAGSDWSTLGAGASTSPGATVVADVSGATAVRWMKSCKTGSFCAYQYIGNDKYRYFRFTKCGDYKLYNWTQTRSANNDRNRIIRFKDANGHKVREDLGGNTAPTRVDWDPVYTLRLACHR